MVTQDVKYTSFCCTISDEYSDRLPTVFEYLNSLIPHKPISQNEIKKWGLPESWNSEKIEKQREYQIPYDLLNRFKIQAAPIELIRMKILDETPDFVVISKPVKMHSLPQSYQETDNVLSELRSMGRLDLLQVNRKSYERGLLFRIDFETSGLLIFAKSDYVYETVRNNFSRHMIKKEYVLACSGLFKDQGTWIDRLVPFGEKGYMMKVLAPTVKDIRAVSAQLFYRTLFYDSSKNITWIAVRIATGARHQIRVQFASRGFPIYGDKLYCPKENLADHVDRLHLHCFRYVVEWKGKHYTFVDQTWKAIQHFPPDFLK